MLYSLYHYIILATTHSKSKTQRKKAATVKTKLTTPPQTNPEDNVEIFSSFRPRGGNFLNIYRSSPVGLAAR